MIEERLLDKDSVTAYQNYLVEGISSNRKVVYDTQYGAQDIRINSDRLVSPYQGRIYVNDIDDAFDSDGNIRIDLLWETISESYRMYCNGERDKLDDVTLQLLKGAIL